MQREFGFSGAAIKAVTGPNVTNAQRRNHSSSAVVVMA